MTDKKKLPLSVSEFPRLISENYIYVDKTQYIHKMLVQGGAFFLSRPRRFGKSLLVSTLKEIFLGNRELFKGYWIYDRIQWQKYTVLHLDFLRVYHDKLGIDKSLANTLNRIANEHGVQCDGDNNSERFDDLIRKLAKDKPIVILIDEYDKPITEYIENVKKAEEHRNALESFFSVLKSQSQYIHFLFITGVTRYTRQSYPLLPNHLVDLTFHKDYVPLLGYTTEEIEANFHEYIGDYVQKNVEKVPGYGREEWFKQLQEKYYGYSWDGKTFVYNPISIVHFFYYQEFKSFWFSTGSPTLLVRLARATGFDVRAWEELEVTKQFFDKFDISNINLNLLLFQTGYLTIQKNDGDINTLSYPNREVEEGLLYYLVEEFSGQNIYGNLTDALKESLEKNDINGFIDKMKSFLAAIPYPLVTGDVEKYYHLVFYLVLKLAMGKVHPEHFSNRGRMDMVIETDHYIYILEFKMDSAARALKQINDKAYYEQYLDRSKTIILIGIGFSQEQRNIADYVHTEIRS